MKLLPILLAFGFCAGSNVRGAFTINITAKMLQLHNGAPAPTDSLLQLVDLGPNGIWDSASFGNPWVGGDDSLINLPFGSSEFSSAAAFDLFEGEGGELGILDRTFTFSTLPPGIKIGLQWWPYLKAENYPNETPEFQGLIGYKGVGRFTRQNTAQNGGDLWVTPSNGVVTFDPLITQNLGGPDADSLGRVNAAPEPGAATLVLAGLFAIGSRRRRG